MRESVNRGCQQTASPPPTEISPPSSHTEISPPSSHTESSPPSSH